MYRFSCASVCKDSIAFKFHGNPRIWDGKTIRKSVKGNSVLYILLDDDQVCVTLRNVLYHLIV